LKKKVEGGKGFSFPRHFQLRTGELFSRKRCEKVRMCQGPGPYVNLESMFQWGGKGPPRVSLYRQTGFEKRLGNPEKNGHGRLREVGGGLSLSNRKT